MQHCKLMISLALLYFCNAGRVACSPATTQNLSHQAADQPVLWDYYEHLQRQPLQYQPLETEQTSQGEQAHYTLISQQWSPRGLVKPATWEHQVTLYRPTGAVGKTALLVVNNGRNTSKADGHRSDYDNQQLIALAHKTATVVVSVDKVPNQPLIYNNDNIPRFEDSSIARSWRLFLDNPQPGAEFPLHLPMVGAIVKAMDLAETELRALGVTIEGFIVTGASKRGWATWLTALVDQRIQAIVPFAIELLDLAAVIEHTQHTLGGYFPIAWQPYAQEAIIQDRCSPAFNALMAIVDPVRYLQSPLAARLAIPKYVISASGDDFFMPDNVQFGLSKLPGVTTLRVVPNSNHYGIKRVTLQALTSFIQRQQTGRALPTLSLVKQGNDKEPQYRLQLSEAPSQLRLWRALNPQLRDFRKSSGITYQAERLPLPAQQDSGYSCELDLPLPATGWSASFVEAEFADGFIATTPVLLLPECYPSGPPDAAYIAEKHLIPGTESGRAE
ncbi:PhoPQ-activated protein PqaA family protein [unidentified bacterial endosymbiont]|uniref:PhoPQ-activated protein PqaA family protein n=1 Tax=unidentified bacterial endosymbiont TaxID=2355 RepID=UPI00209F328C|nr:PhoPQ-activated protein PqaA family protein [unidentified bacterial endosymbiont]